LTHSKSPPTHGRNSDFLINGHPQRPSKFD
jgi:hypothetical protein